MTISFESRVLADHVRIECSGTYTLESTLWLFEQAFARAAAAGRDAALIDVRNLGGREPTLAERYAHGVRIAELQAEQSPRIRLAVFGHEPMIHREQFGEIVASRHGARVRTFTEEALALEWLLSRGP